MRRLGVLFVLIFIGSASAASLQQDGRFAPAGLTEREVETFFISFRDAISAGDKKTVASMLSYPIPVTLSSGARRKIRNRVEFIKNYDRIFDDEFRQLITKTQVSELWARSSGVATPGGAIWINGICKDKSCRSYTLKITTLNGPIRS